MKKLGQTATEYMVVLAIVIIISLIVAAILGQFPGLGAPARVRGSSAFWHSADMGVMHFSISEDGANDDVIITLRNNNNFLVSITDIIVEDVPLSFTPFVLGVGVQETTYIAGAGPFCTRSGDPFSVSLTLRYRDESTGETYTFSGRGNKLEGKCAD